MRAFIRLVSLALLGFIGLPLHAAAVEGKDYVVVTPAQPTSDAAKIMVTEFFSYQCPHCFVFSKPVAAWARQLPADVRFERVPVSLGRPSWEPVARAYYSLVSMKVLEKYDDGLFRAIHERHIALDTEASIAAWLESQGLDAKAFSSQFNSFGINTQVRSADARARDHRIPSIPAMVIDGRYLVAIEDNGHFNDQLAVVNELIAKVRKDRPKK